MGRKKFRNILHTGAVFGAASLTVKPLRQGRSHSPRKLSIRRRHVAAAFEQAAEVDVNSSLTTWHHNAFDRSDYLHGRAVSQPESESQSQSAGGFPRWSVFGSRSIVSAPSPAMERDLAPLSNACSAIRSSKMR